VIGLRTVAVDDGTKVRRERSVDNNPVVGAQVGAVSAEMTR
jgi:hypothetical protein